MPESHIASLHDNCILHDLGETQLLVVIIEFHIVRTHEHITENDQRTCWCWNIQTSHAEQALALVVDDVIRLLKGVLVSTEHDINGRCLAVAINGVLPVE